MNIFLLGHLEYPNQNVSGFYWHGSSIEPRTRSLGSPPVVAAYLKVSPNKTY
jgi:hypothetical protein